jgi:ribosomal-protein-alanine N-acetyltransferase
LSWQNRPVDTHDLTLQLASRRDSVRLASMSRDLIEAGLGWNYQPQRIRRLIEDPETATLVARSGDTIAGFGMMKFGDERAHLVLLAVCPAFQRHGIGARLTEWLTESAAVAGMASIHVELRALNSGAYEFYRSIGFSETLRLPGYYSGRETAIRMIRMLRVPERATRQ